MAIDTNYQMKKGESSTDYTKRVDEYNASKPGATTEPPVDPFIKTIQEKLVSQAGVISSANTNIEQKINEAISGVQTSTEKGSDAIRSTFGRELGYQADNAQKKFTDFNESRTGFATQMSAFRNLVETTDKEQKDLIQRREELILANDSAGASKVSDLIVKGLEFKQKAAQDMFTNILQTGAFGLQVQSEQRAGREFLANLGLNKERLALDKDIAKKDEEAKMASIATEYGVTVEPGDTLADVVKRATPQASAEAKARLNRMLAETAKIQADFAKNETMANFQSRIAQLMTEGSTQSEAVLQAMSEGKAIGLDITPELFNSSITMAEEMKKELDKQTQATVSSSGSNYWAEVMAGTEGDTSLMGIPARAAVLPGKAFEAWKNLVGF